MTNHPEPVTSGDDDAGTVAWRSLVAEATERLSDAGFENASGDARRIVERASGVEGAEYVVMLDDLATRRGVHFFDLMLQRRLVGEPLQYVLGRWAFRALDLFVDPRVLIPRPETEVVAGHAIDELERLRTLRGSRDRLIAVDLGTGSGAIALSLASECPGVEVWATDRSQDALGVARANLAGLGPGATRVRLSAGSWFTALPEQLRGAVDLIVSNPPYVAESESLPGEVVNWEPRDALFAGQAGTEALELIVAGAPDFLSRPGTLVVELAPGQGRVVASVAREYGFNEIIGFCDLAGRERGLIARFD